MTYTKKITIETEKNSIICISDSVWEAVKDSGIKNGIIVVETPHSTAGIIRMTEKAKKAHQDFVYESRRIVPSRIDYMHQESADDAAGHIKSAMFGTSVSACIAEGELIAGHKLGYFFIEYDGPRMREYYISIIGE